MVLVNLTTGEVVRHANVDIIYLPGSSSLILPVLVRSLAIMIIPPYIPLIPFLERQTIYLTYERMKYLNSFNTLDF